ncbi:MAG: pilus assembly protein TadG, partial [Hyphomicrobiales bacterium]
MQAWQPARQRFLANQRGNVVLTFTILSPAVILSVGAAVDFSYLSLQKSNLQQAVDAAAIAA